MNNLVESRKIGKVIGGEHYVHKDYEHVLSDQDGLNKAKQHLSPEHLNKYNAVKHNKKEGTFSFIHSPDFDKSDEPISGESHKVHPDGRVTITKQKSDPQIWHHKWQWVADDYKGFDVEKSKQRSKNHKVVTDHIKLHSDPKVMKRIGTKSYWDKNVVPHIKECKNIKTFKQLMEEIANVTGTPSTNTGGVSMPPTAKPDKKDKVVLFTKPEIRKGKDVK